MGKIFNWIKILGATLFCAATITATAEAKSFAKFGYGGSVSRHHFQIPEQGRSREPDHNGVSNNRLVNLNLDYHKTFGENAGMNAKLFWAGQLNNGWGEIRQNRESLDMRVHTIGGKVVFVGERVPSRFTEREAFAGIYLGGFHHGKHTNSPGVEKDDFNGGSWGGGITLLYHLTDDVKSPLLEKKRLRFDAGYSEAEGDYPFSGLNFSLGAEDFPFFGSDKLAIDAIIHYNFFSNKWGFPKNEEEVPYIKGKTWELYLAGTYTMENGSAIQLWLRRGSANDVEREQWTKIYTPHNFDYAKHITEGVVSEVGVTYTFEIYNSDKAAKKKAEKEALKEQEERKKKKRKYEEEFLKFNPDNEE